MNKFDLKNKTAIITGGAQGFGLDIAKKFLDFGAKVRLWDIDENELKKAKKEISSENLEYDVVDVSNYKVVNSTVSNISKKEGRSWKKIDHGHRSRPLRKMSDFLLTLNGVRGCTKEISEARPHENNG